MTWARTLGIMMLIGLRSRMAWSSVDRTDDGSMGHGEAKVDGARVGGAETILICNAKAGTVEGHGEYEQCKGRLYILFGRGIIKWNRK